MLVATRSSWLWSGWPQRIGRRIHSPRPESELQHGVTWKLCPVRVGDETDSVHSCPDRQRMSCARISFEDRTRMGTASINYEIGSLGAEGSNEE